MVAKRECKGHVTRERANEMTERWGSFGRDVGKKDGIRF